MPTFKLYIITATDDDKGRLVSVTSSTLPELPAHRIHRRANQAFRLGSQKFRELDSTDTDVIGFTITTTTTTGEMALYNARRMDTMSTTHVARFTPTGTGPRDVYPLIPVGKRTFGKFLSDCVAKA